MDSSNIDIRAINRQIIAEFQEKACFSPETAMYVENIDVCVSPKIKYYLIEEFIRLDFVRVLDDGKIYFLEKKWNFEKKKTQTIYYSMIILPIIIGILMIIF